jgi:hypothetical protein
LPSWGNGAPALRVDVPDGYQLHHQKGPDFDVFSFTSLRTGGSLGIYVGHHPSVDPREAAPSRGGYRWLFRDDTTARRRVYGADALVEGLFAGQAGAGVSKLLVHVFVRGPSQAVVDELKAAAETIRRASGSK